MNSEATANMIEKNKNLWNDNSFASEILITDQGIFFSSAKNKSKTAN